MMAKASVKCSVSMKKQDSIISGTGATFQGTQDSMSAMMLCTPFMKIYCR